MKPFISAKEACNTDTHTPLICDGAPLFCQNVQALFVTQVAKAQKQLHKLGQSSVGRELSEVQNGRKADVDVSFNGGFSPQIIPF